jgi:hypothetical protein
MQAKPTCQAKGRTHLDGKPSKPVANVRTMDDGDLFLRVDCENNPSFWLEVEIDVDLMLARMSNFALRSLARRAMAVRDVREAQATAIIEKSEKQQNQEKH